MLVAEFESDTATAESAAEWSGEFRTTVGEHVVSVAKVGGGTVGREYTGNWSYVVATVSGEILAKGSDLYTGTLHMHWEAARTALELVLSD